MCPMIWWTGINGFPVTKDIVLAACTPIKRLPISPGPYVTPIAVMSSSFIFALDRSSSKTIVMFSIWLRLAISGTTPP